MKKLTTNLLPIFLGLVLATASLAETYDIDGNDHDYDNSEPSDRYDSYTPEGNQTPDVYIDNDGRRTNTIDGRRAPDSWQTEGQENEQWY